MERITYTAKAERSGNWWAISVADVPGALTQARRLDQAPMMVREVIALLHDVPEDSFDVQVLPSLGAAVDAILDNLEQARIQLRLAETRLQAASRQTVEVLTTQCGLTVRDAGIVMGVSFQRVSQVAQQLAETDSLGDELGEFDGSTFGNGAELVAQGAPVHGHGHGRQAAGGRARSKPAAAAARKTPN